jgi:hypothetical protein
LPNLVTPLRYLNRRTRYFFPDKRTDNFCWGFVFGFGDGFNVYPVRSWLNDFPRHPVSYKGCPAISGAGAVLPHVDKS